MDLLAPNTNNDNINKSFLPTENGSVQSQLTWNLGPKLITLQLNVEDISRYKSEYFAKLVRENNVFK